jgi:hypothetical protein
MVTQRMEYCHNCSRSGIALGRCNRGRGGGCLAVVMRQLAISRLFLRHTNRERPANFQLAHLARASWGG